MAFVVSFTPVADVKLNLQSNCVIKSSSLIYLAQGLTNGTKKQSLGKLRGALSCRSTKHRVVRKGEIISCVVNCIAVQVGVATATA